MMECRVQKTIDIKNKDLYKFIEEINKLDREISVKIVKPFFNMVREKIGTKNIITIGINKKDKNKEDIRIIILNKISDGKIYEFKRKRFI